MKSPGVKAIVHPVYLLSSFLSSTKVSSTHFKPRCFHVPSHKTTLAAAALGAPYPYKELGLVGLLNNMVVLPPPSDIIVILFVVPNAPLLATRHQRPRKGAKT